MARPPAVPLRRMSIAALAAVFLAACSEREKPAGPASIAVAASTKAVTSEAEFAADLSSSMLGATGRGGASIGQGEVVQGALEASDWTLTSGAYFDSWVFTLSEPADIAVSMTSADFDTYLSVYDGGLGALGSLMGRNDDGGDGTNSRIELSLAAGTYSAVAHSFVAGATGAYEMSLSMSGGDQIIRAGRTTEGALATADTMIGGRHVDYWYFTGSAGEVATFNVASSAFDTYVAVHRGGWELAANDDGFITGTNSSVTLTLPAHGAYMVAITSFNEGRTGEYTLTASSEGGRPAFAGFGSGGDPNERYALLVGIDHYARAGDLVGPIIDTRTMERVLVDKFGFSPANVVTLNDSDATRRNIAQGIAQHLGQAGPNGVAVFFFAGHGTQLGANIGLTGPLDPEPAGVGDQAIVVYGYDDLATVLLDEELGYLIETLDAGRSLVVVDACFSGEITRGAGEGPQSRMLDLTDSRVAGAVAMPTDFITRELRDLELGDMSLGFGDFAAIAKAFQNPQRHLQWGAATELQESFSRMDDNGGVFTYALGERLMNATGSETFEQIHRLVHDDAVTETSREIYGQLQNPQMRGPNQSMTLNDFFRRR